MSIKDIMVESTNTFVADEKILLVIVSPGEPDGCYLESVKEDGQKILEFGKKYGFEIKHLGENEATPRNIDNFLSKMKQKC